MSSASLEGMFMDELFEKEGFQSPSCSVCSTSEASTKQEMPHSFTPCWPNVAPAACCKPHVVPAVVLHTCSR